MNKNQKGIGAVEILLILVIIGILSGTGWYVYNSNKKTNYLLNSAENTKILNPKSIKKNTENNRYSYKPIIPNGWKVYNNSEYGFSFAYPQEWGNLQTTKPGLGSDYDPYWLLYTQSRQIDQHDSSGIKGNLDVSVVSMNFKEFRTVKAGTPLEYVNKGSSEFWIASTKVDVESDNYKPGDKVPIPIEKKINSKSIFHIEGNYECNQNAEWWFAAAKGIVQIAMPRFSPIGGEPTGVCSGTKQISDTYWKSVYEQIVDTINIF
jgi:hypothetical protein